MTHDKVRQDFLAWATTDGLMIDEYLSISDEDFPYYIFKTAYQAGRAAERAEIREKLEPILKTDKCTSYSAIYKAITKILEVI